MTIRGAARGRARLTLLLLACWFLFGGSAAGPPVKLGPFATRELCEYHRDRMLKTWSGSDVALYSSPCWDDGRR